MDTVPATLAFYRDTSTVELPDFALAGDSVVVRFNTFGGGCIGPGPVNVVVSGLRAEVRPYHEQPAASQKEVVCTSDLRFDPHVVHLRFEQPGTARVRIVGVAVPEGKPFVIERALQIHP
jgi:hypothetical protein